MKELIERYAEYNLWVNERLVNFLKNQPAEVFEREIVSSFPSIRRTFLHIWAAEAIWLLRLEKKPISGIPSQQFEGSYEAICQGFLANSKRFLEFVREAPTAFLTSDFEYADLSGNIFTQKPADMIQHCLNHSTFHRGQIITMCRQCGLSDLPRTDYIIFIREEKR